MKKLLKYLLVLTLVFGLAACSGGEKPGGGDESETVKVALLVENLGDLSFNDSAKEGTDRAQKDFDVDVKVIEYGTDVSKQETYLLEAAEDEYDVIIAPSNYADYMEEHAASYPDKTFIIFDATVDYDAADVKNVYSIVYSANEASYAAGFLAAKQSETGVIGFLGGEEAPVINDFLVGYIEGALKADPNVKVAVSFVGDWQDSAKGKELSLAMNNQGADVIFGAAGGAGMGIFEAAVEKDLWAIGVDLDQALKFESDGQTNFANVTISSVQKNVGYSLYRALELYTKGELKIGAAETLGLKENGVGLSDNKYYQEFVSEEIRNEVKAVIDDVSNGDIKVTVYYGMDQNVFTSLKDSVRP